MRVRDLPIYSEYPEKDYELEWRPGNVAEEKLLPYIKPVRVELVKWCGCLQKSTSKSAEKVSAVSSSFYQRFRDEPIQFARGGFITVCGLGGIVLGYKGGIFRKLFYATLSASAATVACYPSMARNYGETAWHHSKGLMLEWKEKLEKKK